MSSYEVLTRLSNGKKKPHLPGAVVQMDDTDAVDLVAINALRPIARTSVEADGEPVGTAQRSMAAATAGDESLSFVTASTAMRADLDKYTVKELDQIATDERVEFDGSLNKAGKIEAIVSARSSKLLGTMDRRQLLDLAVASGYADVAALELAEDAAEDEIRVALMRVAAAKAD